MYRILIVEDDPSISELIDMNLTVCGYKCETVADGAQALSAIRRKQYDLALLDIMLPEIDGFELLPYMKKHNIPVIYVSAKSDTRDRVRGLRLGAEDYMVKPFDILELLVRMEKVLDRGNVQHSVITVCGVTINQAERKVLLDSGPVELKPLEYALALMFIKHPNIVLTREQLLREVWGDEFFGETRTVDSHVAVIRKKLDWSDKIITVHRIGYKLEVI